MSKQDLIRRVENRRSGSVHSLTKWRWLKQAAAVGLVGGALWGCGAAPEGGELAVDAEAGPGSEAELGTLEQAITGGSLVPGNFTSVVKFQQDGPCTATKIKGTNKFLTAAHCISNELATSLTIFTGNDGSSGQINLSIPSGGIQKHPSFKLRNGSNALDVYDIAVITTTTATPGIAGLDLPPSENPHAVPSTGTAYGFGCDANDSTHSGKRQSGFFNLTGGTLDHCLSSTGPDVVCAGDSGGPLLSNADASIIGVFDAGFGGSVSFWSRTGNVLRWLFNPKPGNDPSLFQGVAGDLVFMHNKKVGSVPTGLCMVGNSNVHYPPNPVNVILHKCSDWKGLGAAPFRRAKSAKSTSLLDQPQARLWDRLGDNIVRVV